MALVITKPAPAPLSLAVETPATEVKTNVPAVFYAVVMPPGTWVSQAGIFEGAPTKAGLYHCKVKAEAEGEEAITEFDWEIAPIKYQIRAGAEAPEVVILCSTKDNGNSMYIRVDSRTEGTSHYDCLDLEEFLFAQEYPNLLEIH